MYPSNFSKFLTFCMSSKPVGAPEINQPTKNKQNSSKWRPY